MFPKLKFFLQCLWYFHLTPKQLRERFSNLCLLASPEPTFTFDYATEFEITGNQANSVMVCQKTELLGEFSESNIALNTAKDGGFIVQLSVGDRWNEVLRVSMVSSITPGKWIKPLRCLFKLNLKPEINPLPIYQLKVPNE